MPNCFSLTRKTDLAAGPVGLNTIDAEMCEHFGVPVHPKYYAMDDWYNSIGFNVAMGRSMESQRAWGGIFPDWPYTDNQLKALDWLIANFTEDAWAQIGRFADVR